MLSIDACLLRRLTFNINTIAAAIGCLIGYEPTKVQLDKLIVII